MANTRADQVKNGEALEPVGMFGIEMLAVRADPARIHVVGRPGLQAKRVEALQSHRLFYLGRSTTTIVLYDQTTQRALHFPVATLLVETSNCGIGKTRDVKCEELVDQPRDSERRRAGRGAREGGGPARSERSPGSQVV